MEAAATEMLAAELSVNLPKASVTLTQKLVDEASAGVVRAA
jgi:hypothetical protein